MRKPTGKTAILLCLLVLVASSAVACSAQTTTTAPSPTLDLNPIRTQVAATVLAQVPQLCALTPTAAPPPANTVAAPATATTAPTVTATAATTGTVTGTTNDLAMWVSQTVQDNTIYAPGQQFIMGWTIKNVGTSTWTANYRLRYYSGNQFGAPKDILLGKEVKPGETVEITADMKAPTIAGEYRSDWVMSNESLRNFKEPVFLKIKVAAPTATATKPPAPTSTVTPTATKAP